MFFALCGEVGLREGRVYLFLSKISFVGGRREFFVLFSLGVGGVY